MYAAIVTVTIDAGREDAALQMLQSQIVPMVKQSPGFVSGVWLDPVGGKGLSVVVFESEEHARAVAPPVGCQPDMPVTIDSVEFRGVAARA